MKKRRRFIRSIGNAIFSKHFPHQCLSNFHFKTLYLSFAQAIFKKICHRHENLVSYTAMSFVSSMSFEGFFLHCILKLLYLLFILTILYLECNLLAK